MTALVRLEHVCFARDGRSILDDIGFAIERGERVAIVGPNGAGKSTLLRLIAALESPDEGLVERSVRIAWVPQRYSESLFPWFSVLRNVGMPRSIAKMRDAAEVASRLCKSLLPSVDPSALAGALSGGQQQATAIARALAWPADVVLADEPLSAIDARAKPFVRRAIREELGDHGLLLVTHDPKDAADLCDRVMVLESGRLVAA